MLESFWYVAAESTELGTKPLGRIVFGKPVVIFRDSSGKPFALEDRCAHRNFPLSKGRVLNSALQCPYHGWCYEGSGAVAKIPAVPDQESTCSSIKIPGYPCLEQEGFIWIVPSGHPAAEAPVKFPNLGRTGYLTFRMKTRFAGSVETCLENFLDCPHAAFVHNRLFRQHSRKTVRTQLRRLTYGAEVEYFSESRRGGIVWKMMSPGNRSELKHIDRFIRPATSQVEYSFCDGRQYTITSACTPVSERETEVYTVITFCFGALGFMIKPWLRLMSRVIIRQDVRVVSEQGQNIARFGGTAKYRVVRSDLLLPHIVQWRNALRSAKDLSAYPQLGVEQEDVAICI